LRRLTHTHVETEYNAASSPLRLMCIVLFGCAVGYAQEARLNGTVSDPSGAAVANVRIVANQAERNLPFETITDSEGRYLFPRLPIGPTLFARSIPASRPSSSPT
jgi:hypothetical protein